MKRRFPRLTIVIALTALGCHLVPGASEALQFDRAAVGEWWRWATAHLVHFSADHLTWDVAVFLVLGTWCEWQSWRRTAAALLTAAVAIPAAVWWLQPQFEIYRGLSGLDSALFGLAAGALVSAHRRPARVVGAVALAGFAVKCALEIQTATTVFASGDGYAPVPLAHIVGIAAGVAVAALSPIKAALRTTYRRRQTPC